MVKKRKSGAANDGVEEVYNVEKIVGKRIKDSKVQYCIKWEGYSEEDNTWEYEDNVFCKDLIKEFEENERKPSPPRKKLVSKKSSIGGGNGAAGAGQSPKSNAANEKLKENILQPGKWDAYVDCVSNVERDDENKELLIYLKWHDGDETCHPSKVVNINCPQKIIQFYEDHLKFKEES